MMGIACMQVSTPALETAAQYVLQQALALKEQAEATRPDLLVEVSTPPEPCAALRCSSLTGHLSWRSQSWDCWLLAAAS